MKAAAHTHEELREICSQFRVYGDFLVAVPFGTGHINDTYQVTYDQGGIRLHYTLQRINRNVFKNPEALMENMERVTCHIMRKIRLRGEQGHRRTLRLLHSYDGRPFAKDSGGDYWRLYIFVENARSYDVLEGPELAFGVAKAFGAFQGDLVDIGGGRLNETIPNFHNTPKRLEALEAAIREDRCGRAASVAREIDFIMERKEDTALLLRLHAEGSVPERITHNDTKVNNILIDDLTGEGICVIDLDTVMPGLALYDFGDMVRAGTSPAEEDETDLCKVFMRFEMFEALLKGFLSTAGNFLTSAEREHLPFSGKLITLETGIRFLTDYLSGDVYFKIARENHNLDRCRTQLALVDSIEKQYNQMRKLL